MFRHRFDGVKVMYTVDREPGDLCPWVLEWQRHLFGVSTEGGNGKAPGTGHTTQSENNTSLVIMSE